MKDLNRKRYVKEPALLTAHLLGKELENLSYFFRFKKKLINFLYIIYIFILYTAKKQKI